MQQLWKCNLIQAHAGPSGGLVIPMQRVGSVYKRSFVYSSTRLKPTFINNILPWPKKILHDTGELLSQKFKISSPWNRILFTNCMLRHQTFQTDHVHFEMTFWIHEWVHERWWSAEKRYLVLRTSTEFFSRLLLILISTVLLSILGCWRFWHLQTRLEIWWCI